MRLTRRFPFIQWTLTAFLYFHHHRAWAAEPPTRSAERRFWGWPTFRHPAATLRRSGAALGQMGVHMLMALSLAVVCWNLQAAVLPAAANSSGFDLRREVASSKLNTTSAEVVALPAGPPPQIKLDKQKTVEPEPIAPPSPLPAIEPVLPPPPPVVVVPPVQAPQLPVELPVPTPPPPLAPVPAVVELPPPTVRPPARLTIQEPIAADPAPRLPAPAAVPAIREAVWTPPAPASPCIYVQHPGDTPMLRNWKLFGVTTMMVFALTAPAPAGDKDGPPQDDKFTKLEKQIEAFKSEMAKEFASLGIYVNGLKDDIKSLKADTKVKLELGTARLNLLDQQLTRLRQDMDSLKNGGTKAYYPPDGKDVIAELKAEIAQLRLIIAKSSPVQPLATTATTGQLTVVNRYPEEILLMVNGGEQGRIPANTSRLIENLPLGTVTYEIISPTWGSSGIRRSTILPGDGLRVNVQ